MAKNLVSSESLKKALKALKKATDQWGANGFGGVCFGAILDINGDPCYAGWHIHTACHSWLTSAFTNLCGYGSTFNYTYTTIPPNAKNFLTLTCHTVKKTTASPEATREIARWMAEESPFSEFVLNKGDDLEHGLILLCGPDGLSLAQAMWICKVLRYSVEGSKALDTWLTLYKGGVNPMLAVLVATKMSTVTGATFGLSDVQSHCTVFNYNSYGDSSKYSPNLNKLIKGVSDPKALSTSTLFSTVSPGETAKINSKIASFAKTTKSDDGWGKVVSIKGATAEELVRQVLDWEREITGAAPVEKARKPAKKPTRPLPGRKTVFLEELDL